MITKHHFLIEDSRKLSISDNSIDLIVTSPPYPMVEMWDDCFTEMDPKIKDLLLVNPRQAFLAMHATLMDVWRECWRVLKPGGIACINIGDATRTIDEFQLYSNHAKIIEDFTSLGFHCLPDILWRKPNNSPNKFLGSGMLPVGAYVTYEHEYILIFRKPKRRQFKKDKDLRRKSAFFWEERNEWFSDLWTIKGAKQTGHELGRDRSAAYPFEIPRRLISMFSIYGDTVLDPFAGTGTTSLASVALGRNSVAVDLDPGLKSWGDGIEELILNISNADVDRRLYAHKAFVLMRRAKGKELKNVNKPYDVPVVTKQEKNLVLYRARSCSFSDDMSELQVEYGTKPSKDDISKIR